MSQPTREEVQAFIDALRYGMKVGHKPEFLIAMAEGWLESKGGGQALADAKSIAADNHVHHWVYSAGVNGYHNWRCACGSIED